MRSKAVEKIYGLFHASWRKTSYYMHSGGDNVERFKRFIDTTLNMDNIREKAHLLHMFGVECTYFPDPVEDLDEFEFKTDFEGEDIIICFAVERCRVKRLMFVHADTDNPEIVKSLSPAELENFLSERAEQMLNFYKYITK